MTPHEVYFYSSGAVEEGWTPKDISLNRANAMIGYGLGGFLSFALMITAGALFLPLGIEPELIGTVALGAQVPLGQIGLLLALVGILFAVGARRSTPVSRVRTTSRSSSAGNGGNTADRVARRGSRSPGSACSRLRSS
jgi:membrane protein implicated in regulation of membrane protease activity